MGGACSTYGERRGIDRVLVGAPGDKRPTGRPWRRWEDTVKMDIKGIGWEVVECILLAQIRDRRCL